VKADTNAESNSRGANVVVIAFPEHVMLAPVRPRMPEACMVPADLRALMIQPTYELRRSFVPASFAFP
jgi:hypothetical protein